MVKNKPPSKDNSRKVNESLRRMEINRGIDRVGKLIPYLNFVSSFTGQKVKPTKNGTLRLASAYVNIATSEKYNAYLQNRDPSTEKLIEFFNQVRSEMKCSFFLGDGSTKILFAHDGVFEKFGYDATDVIGHKLENLLIPPDELEDFRANLLEVKHKLIIKGVKEQYFTFTCHLQHQKRNKSTTQHRSRVIFSGNMFLSKVSNPRRKQIAKQGNGHITVKESDTMDNISDDSFFFFGQIEIISDELFRQSFLTVVKNQYVLFMTTSGRIYYVDQRVVRVLGRTPLELMHKPAHNYIVQSDLRLALYAHLSLLKHPTDVCETVHRLLDCSDNMVYINSFGVLYQEKGETIFKCTAIQIDESEGEAKLNHELQLLPKDFQDCPLEKLINQVKERAEKYNQKSIEMNYSHDSPQEQSNENHLITSPVCESKFEVNSDYLITNTSANFQTSLNQSPPSLLTKPQLHTDSFSHNNQHQNGQLNNNSIIEDNNQTQTSPMTMSNSMVYRYMPVTSIISTDETMFTPNQQQIFNFPSPVPSSTSQPVNNDHVFIHNINININNNNFIMYNNSNQHLIADHHHHLPAEGEGAFVNLIPFLEHDIAHNDLNPTK